MARIIPLESAEHHGLQALLPWYVNGTLDAAEATLVREHLVQCPRCQAEVAWQERLRAASPPAEITPPADLDRQWSALRQRLGKSEPMAAPPRRNVISGWFAPRWVWPAIAAQAFIVVAAATAWVALPQHEENFRTLGAVPAAATANALVVFRPGASEADIRRTLRSNRAQVVGGPTVTDAYLLRLSVLSPEALARLRADATVLRVESLEGEAR